MTRIGLVGCGRWGAHILRDLRALGCEVHVADPAEAARVAARKGGAESCSAAARALPSVDGVVVASPASTHASSIAELLPRAVPLFVEKPLAPAAADRARLATLPASDARRVFVMHKWRRHPAVEAIAAIARSGELGPVRSVLTIRNQPEATHADVDALWTLAPHDVSIALEILGCVPEPRLARAERDPARGAVVRFHGTSGTAPFHAMEIALGVAKRRSIVVTFRDGIASIDGERDAEITIVRDDGARAAPEVRSVSSELPLLRELRDFVGFLAGGPPPKSTLADGLAVDGAVAKLRSLAGLPD